MPLTRSYHHGDLRATLIALASDHIAAGGVETLSLRALAREAGVAHRAAYQHFPDIDALIATTFADAYGRLDALCAAPLAGAASPDAHSITTTHTPPSFRGRRLAEPGIHCEASDAMRRGPQGSYEDARPGVTASMWQSVMLTWLVSRRMICQQGRACNHTLIIPNRRRQ
ncbi:MAG: TetR/AcrR family transcriptional regulator [Parvularculaceae bacterium]